MWFTRKTMVVAIPLLIVGGLLWQVGLMVREARRAAYHTADRWNLSQLRLAVANYHDVYGQYPPPCLTDADGVPMHSWRVLVLPYIDGQQLYDRYDFSQPWNSPHNQAIANEMPAVFRFHNVDDDTTTNTNYLAVVGEHTFWPRGGGRTRESITDDWQTTIVVVENTGAGIHWMEPRDLDFDTMTYKWNQPAGISSWYDAPTVLTMTKPLKKIDPSIRPDVLRAMLTVDGGETVSEADESWQLLEDGRDRPTVR